jgi:ATP-dependent RNA helicase RhlE
MSFASLGLSDALVRAVTEHGYTQPTPIQLQAIPAVLAGGDLLAGAQTGTGKTAGFVLPMLQRLASAHAANASASRTGRKPIRALILTPTRELAAQVEESVRVYGKYAKLTSMVMFGGVGIGAQTAQLKRGVDILVATPGRLLDHQGQGNLDLSKVEILVLDEADRMLDMGFIRDIKRILSLLPRKRQNLLFSATFSDEIKDLADDLLDAPALIEVARRNSTVEIITQTVHPVDRDRKRELLSHLIKTQNWFQVLVFTRTKHGANKLAEQLNHDGITALAIHGNKSQGARTRALAEFKDASLQVLVATDIAARGIDIDQLPHVVNYDLPNVPHDYVHRSGGRAAPAPPARRSRSSAWTSTSSCATSRSSSSVRCRAPSSPASSLTSMPARSRSCNARGAGNREAMHRRGPGGTSLAARRGTGKALRIHRGSRAAVSPRTAIASGACTRRARPCSHRSDTREAAGHPPFRRTRPIARPSRPGT